MRKSYDDSANKLMKEIAEEDKRKGIEPEELLQIESILQENARLKAENEKLKAENKAGFEYAENLRERAISAQRLVENLRQMREADKQAMIEVKNYLQNTVEPLLKKIQDKAENLL